MGPERRKDFGTGSSRGCALGKGEKEAMSLIEEYLKERIFTIQHDLEIGKRIVAKCEAELKSLNDLLEKEKVKLK